MIHRLHATRNVLFLRFIPAYMPRLSLYLALIVFVATAAATPPALAQTDGVGFGASIGVTNGASAFDRNPVGRLVTRMTTDLDVITEMFAAGALTIFMDVLTLVGIVVMYATDLFVAL
jgi:ABC-type multidrug transport system fused ATPase/permease subunit